MIRLGVNTMIWSGHFDESRFSLLASIRCIGFTSVEVPVFDFDSFDPAPLRSAASNEGLELTVSSAMPPELSLASESFSVRQSAREWLQRALEKVDALGSRILAGPMYTPVGDLPGRRRSSSEWSWVVEEYRQLGAAMEGCHTRLAVEPLNRFETHFLNTAADARLLCEQVSHPSIGILFDTFHANIEEKSIAGAVGSLGPWLIHVHFSENDRGIPGSGHIPFKSVARTLIDTGYRGCVVVESFASSIPEIAAATAIWRDFAASPEEFAAVSFANLSGLFSPDRLEPAIEGGPPCA